MLIVQIGAVVLTLLISYIVVKKEYKKLTSEEKNLVKEDLKNPSKVLFHLLGEIGYVLLFVGIILSLQTVQFIACLLMGLGWIIDGAEIWETDHRIGLV
ncbi:hypothetical protein Q73_06040 [Bacillus coahuilensis m2-6]|uniref:hypothetical protein n=1 Tax=Bacillus coahuilensis TaxID=408580 RepID=UPI0001850EAF|nr:hypothetical protein [Bacillus coahuilensis]KUP08470.1 hypothetical protein Q73_06040 [Bacillus coahuilensis m2-6]